MNNTNRIILTIILFILSVILLTGCGGGLTVITKNATVTYGGDAVKPAVTIKPDGTVTATAENANYSRVARIRWDGARYIVDRAVVGGVLPAF